MQWFGAQRIPLHVIAEVCVLVRILFIAACGGLGVLLLLFLCALGLFVWLREENQDREPDSNEDGLR